MHRLIYSIAHLRALRKYQNGVVRVQNREWELYPL
jgi:hypothetical protein